MKKLFSCNQAIMVIFIIAIALGCISAQAADVQISWTANSESDLAGYKVYYGTASGQYGAPVDVGNVTSYLLKLDVGQGATFFFAIAAYDTSGNESAKSAPAPAFIPDRSAPAAPGGLLIVVRVE